MASLKYWVWLSARKGVSGQTALALLERFGSPEQIFYADPAALEDFPGLSETGRQSLSDRGLREAEEILARCAGLDIRLVTLGDAAYPERLKNIYQPPLLLYWKGLRLSLDDEAAVGVVGTRSCTPYGVRSAAKLGLDMARCGGVVVSGIAEGIDEAAVRGALKGGGRVVCVLGGGIDVRYPRKNAALYDDVAAMGALVSEYPPGTEPRGAHFPVRNRIISGVSLGVVVVESGVSGGSMHTVSHALDQDRDVFAFPGPADAPASLGTNRLIQEGAAKLVMSAWDVLEEYADRFPEKLSRAGLSAPAEAERRLADLPRQGQNTTEKTVNLEKTPVDKNENAGYIDWKDLKNKLTDDQIDILLALEERPTVADDLVERTQIPARRVLSALTLLQVQGYVGETAGKRFSALVRVKKE